MREIQEIKLKKALMDFINKEVKINVNSELPPEVQEIMVSDRKHELVDLLFGLFVEFDKFLKKS